MRYRDYLLDTIVFVLVSILAMAAMATAAFADPLADARAAVYAIEQGSISCTASVIAPGRILTTAHCSQGAWVLKTKKGGIPLTLTAVGESDVAEFTGAVDCPCLPLATLPTSMDEPVVTLGYPLGNDLGYIQLMTAGSAQGLDRDGDLIYTAPTAPGNSGGPLLALRSGRYEIVGVVKRGVRIGPSFVFHLACAAPLEKVRALIDRKE